MSAKMVTNTYLQQHEKSSRNYKNLLFRSSSVLLNSEGTTHRSNLICRRLKEGKLGPRVRKSLCNGTAHRKILNRTVKNRIGASYRSARNRLISVLVEAKNTKRVTWLCYEFKKCKASKP